jgi:hypothetical protein
MAMTAAEWAALARNNTKLARPLNPQVGRETEEESGFRRRPLPRDRRLNVHR